MHVLEKAFQVEETRYLEKGTFIGNECGIRVAAGKKSKLVAWHEVSTVDWAGNCCEG